MLTVLQGDALEVLKTLAPESVQCCVTSPPYWGLRDYGTAAWEGGDAECDHVKARGGHLADWPGNTRGGGHQQAEAQTVPFNGDCGKCGARRIDSQLGLEPTPELYVERMVLVFREVRRVLRKDGTLWLNLGSTMAGGGNNSGNTREISEKQGSNRGNRYETKPVPPGFKPKDLVPIPWMVAMALQADGWYLRSDIIWAKPNPMPESVTDRPTKAHEYVFLLTRSPTYFYDAEAIREAAPTRIVEKPAGWNQAPGRHDTINGRYEGDGITAEISGRNKRSVWTIATQPYPDAHFATYPPSLIKPMILAGTSARGCCSHCGAPWERIIERELTGRGNTMSQLTDGIHDRSSSKSLAEKRQAYREMDMEGPPPTQTLGWQPTCSHNSPTTPCTVLDPFAGSGTTGQVALELGRKATLIELNSQYVQLIQQRCSTTIGLPLA